MTTAATQEATMTTQTTEDIVLAALPTEADEPDFTYRPTAWDLAETTSLPIRKVRWALRQLGIRQVLVISTYERWGHTDIHYARTAEAE